MTAAVCGRQTRSMSFPLSARRRSDPRLVYPRPNTRVSRRPAVRRLDAHRGTLALVDPAPPASTSKDRRRLWTFASGSAFGALVCVILVTWLTTSEQPRAEQFVPAARAGFPCAAPVSPAALASPTAAEPVILVSNQRSRSSAITRRRKRRKNRLSARCGSIRRHKAHVCSSIARRLASLHSSPAI